MLPDTAKEGVLAHVESLNQGFTMREYRKTLAAVFRDPVSGTIEWAVVEGLLIAAGGRVIEGRGSQG